MAVNNLNTPGVGIQPSLIDAKGDLLVGTANDAIDRLGVTGTTGAVLTADAGETTGLKWAAAGSVGGLVHINTTSVASGVSGINFNDVFSSTYLNYLIKFRGLHAASGVTIRLRMRSAGTDETGTNYNFQVANMFSTTSNATRSTTQTSFDFGLVQNTGTSIVDCQVYRPYLAATTIFSYHCADKADASNPGIQIGAGSHLLTNSYDGFTLFPASGNFGACVVSVYGYKD
jgi:hypothetical protein